MYNKNKVAGAVAAVLGTMMTPQVTAEEANSAQEQQIDETIQVRGIRGSLSRAVATKRISGGVVDAISAEDMGKFPDTNLAESLQRITGVSIDRSGGEGQLITVRGFGPQFNTVLVNGRQMASENRTRAFSFDTLASELVSGIEVYKTSQATLQSGGVGATVNVTTARPFDNPGFKAVASVKGVYDDNSEETSPSVSGLVSTTFNDDTMGIMVAVSHQQRDTRLQRARTDGWLENAGIPQDQINGGAGFEGNIFSPRNYDHQVVFEERTRTGGNLVFQYAPSDNLEITADYLYSDFDVKTDSTSYGHWFTASNLEDVQIDSNGTVTDLYQETGLATDMHSKKFDRLTSTSAFGLNAEWLVSDSLIMKFDYSHSESERAANNGGEDQLSLIGYANRVRFQLTEFDLPYASNFQSANPNIYSNPEEGRLADGDPTNDPVAPSGVSNFEDVANSRAHVMLRRGWEVEDVVDQFRIDGVWDEGVDGLRKLKFGVQYSTEEKTQNRWDNDTGVHCVFCGYPDEPQEQAPQWLFDAGDDFLGEFSGMQDMPTKWLRHNGEEQFAYLEAYAASQGNPISFDAVKRGNSFVVQEDTLSGYVELDFETTIAGMEFAATTGVRLEATDVTVTGTTEPLESLTILDQTEFNKNFGQATGVTKETDYLALLPNLSMRLNITDDLVARFATSQTMTRPTLTDMAPVTVIGTTRPGGDLTASSGNPELVPFKSNNIDLSLEYYYDSASYVSAGFFLKDVSNFIVTQQRDQVFTNSAGDEITDPVTGEAAKFSVTFPNNGETAQVTGWEFAAQHTFGETGFGVMFNATIADSDAELDPKLVGEVFALPGLSDSMNFVGFYEKGPVELRFAYNQRGEFLQSLTQLNGDGVVFVDDYAQWDASGSLELTENFSVFFEALNLTGETTSKHGQYANQFLEAEDSGTRYAVGVRASF
nr:TonB-dependent receptor [Catenovulum sediminis]